MPWKLKTYENFTHFALSHKTVEILKKKTECETMKLKKLVLSLLFLFARLPTIRWILVAHIGKFLHTLHEHAFHSQLEVGGGHHSRNSSDSLSNQELSSPPDHRWLRSQPVKSSRTSMWSASTSKVWVMSENANLKRSAYLHTRMPWVHF